MPENNSTTAAHLSCSDSSTASRNQVAYDETKTHFSIDLISAARWHLAFLKYLSESHLANRSFPILESIRRYKELWMPLLSDLSDKSTKAQMILPPLDVQFVWHCHCLKPNQYLDYCVSEFGRLLERPLIFDQGNEDYASDLCRKIWSTRYPTEPFDLEIGIEEEDADDLDKDAIFKAICRFRELCLQFVCPFMGETVYLVSARQKYKKFIYLCREYADHGFKLVPTSDLLLMWLTHKSFPGVYVRDMPEFLAGADMEFDEDPGENEMEKTRKIWEQEFEEPYERAGSCFHNSDWQLKEVFYWDYSSSSNSESNCEYRILQPRSIMQVFVFLKGRLEDSDGKMFLRLGTMRCNREMKLENPVSRLSDSEWEKSFTLCCEFGTRGLILDLCLRGGSWFGTGKKIKSLSFSWNELIRAPSLLIEKQLGDQIKAMVSITPPIQAPYLLKFVPDRITDDKGSMISDEILRMNQYHPQVGRWISRTVLDCYRRECFVVRLRVGEGIWRRGAETPRAVKKEERIIEVREGSWSYIASSTGVAPHKIVGTAELREEDLSMATWALSTGDLLRIRWQRDLEIEIENENSPQQLRIEVGRKLCYKIEDGSLRSEDEEEFITFIRFSEENPEGRATALLNWRVLAMEFLSEEDAAFMLLVCMAIILALTEMKMKDVGHLLVRRRVKEAMAGIEDWGSVMIHSGSSSCSSRLWFWNPKEFFSFMAMENAVKPIYRYPPADGMEEMYKQAISLSRERNPRER